MGRSGAEDESQMKSKENPSRLKTKKKISKVSQQQLYKELEEVYPVQVMHYS
jgi:hypothetical protein